MQQGWLKCSRVSNIVVSNTERLDKAAQARSVCGQPKTPRKSEHCVWLIVFLISSARMHIVIASHFILFYFVSYDAAINGGKMTSRPVFKMFKEGTS